MGIFDQHAAMLEASKITPEHARARGYVSVDTKTRINNLGTTSDGRTIRVAKDAQKVPGLLIPMLRKDGSRWGYQYRADNPAPGRQKYETLTNQRNGIDVPPGVGPMLDDPSIPLFITEGVKKADAGAIAGLCIIALPGVWNWRGTNGKGGKVAVADWDDIALNGRRFILAFDSDVVVKKSVQDALKALAAYLEYRAAK